MLTKKERKMDMTVRSSNLGYPRIGEKREWKRLLERFWSGQVEEDVFQEQMKALRLSYLKKQQLKGINLIPVNDFTLYDHVLDTAVMFGIVPDRFEHKGGEVSLQTYFEMARGTEESSAIEMTKWYNTNYHYLVPELEACSPSLVHNRPLSSYREAVQELGIEGKPVILGPISFVLLSKGYREHQLYDVIDQFLPCYQQILHELDKEGVKWVQMDEPSLTTSISKDVQRKVTEVYHALKKSAPNLKILLQTYFESVTHYEDVINLPVQGIGLDFVHDRGENFKAVTEKGFPKDKLLAAGVIDGRNIWRANLKEKHNLVKNLTSVIKKEKLIIQPSSSLLHVPVTVNSEPALPSLLKNALSFADQKLDEVTFLTNALHHEETMNKVFEESDDVIQKLNESPEREKEKVTINVDDVNNVKRKAAFDRRYELQKNKLDLPFLPTTTIGSFPQTKEIRKLRLEWRKGELDEKSYRQYIEKEIKKWIEIQEEIGLDVLVHGEFERTDMVEYFGEKLEGFQFTKFGWVQSYGSRCVKPPIIYGNVSFRKPMTVKETVYAQSLTNHPVKGMLTGPITIVNWSFVREDRPKVDICNQVALALRKEVEALEGNQIRIIQVDEPALREGLPLKKELQQRYLDEAVYAFKLTTSSVANETQIHTHMCYSEFEEIIQAIKDLDADVISIETSRSHGELIKAFEDSTYDNGIGLGVYDIHSPRVPHIEEMIGNIERPLQVLKSNLFWINPDCGLKTRGQAETIEALSVMVEAAKQIRKKHLITANK